MRRLSRISRRFWRDGGRRMAWEQLEAINQIQAAEIEAEQELIERPTFCPICGTRLDVNAERERNCPLGHYRTDG